MPINRPRRAAASPPPGDDDVTAPPPARGLDTPRRGLGFTDPTPQTPASPPDDPDTADRTLLRPAGAPGGKDATILRPGASEEPTPADASAWGSAPRLDLPDRAAPGAAFGSTEPDPDTTVATPTAHPLSTEPAPPRSAWARPEHSDGDPGLGGLESADLTAPAAAAFGGRGGATVDAEDKTIDAARLGKPQPKAADASNPELNPFIPKPRSEERRPLLARLRRKDQAPQEPVGKRVAERKPWFKIPTRGGGEKTDKRNVTATLITGAAAVLTIVLVVGVLIWNTNRNSEAMAQSATPVAPTVNDPGPLVDEDSLMTDTMASVIADGQWNATETSDGVGGEDQGMGVACVTTTPEGQPLPQGTFLRTLTADTDKGDTAALHRVDGFNSVDDATKYFQFRASEVGGCQGSPLYVARGYQIAGLGDEAVAVRMVLENQKPEFHTVVVARTGQNVNIIDVARTSEPTDARRVVDAARQVINSQCAAAAGLCSSSDMEMREGVPPAGGDEPGFLAAGDVPRITRGTGNWSGTAVKNEVNIGDGSNCEAVDFGTVADTEKKQQRTYLLRNDPGAPGEFGIDEVVLTMKSSKAASDLVDKVGDSIDDCQQRLLTAKVGNKGEIKAKGTGDMEVEGRWFALTQKLSDNETTKFRVGIVAVGPKVIYLRMNPTDQFDLKDGQWEAITERAGQRASQAT